MLIAENQIEGDIGSIQSRHFEGLAPAGRLDIDSRGLIVFTQDGRIAKLLTGNSGEIDKEYHVRVLGEVTENQLRLLRHGMSLDDKPLLPADVTRLGEGRLRMILREGKHRQIRRMCEAVDLKVVGLMRIPNRQNSPGRHSRRLLAIPSNEQIVRLNLNLQSELEFDIPIARSIPHLSSPRSKRPRSGEAIRSAFASRQGKASQSKMFPPFRPDQRFNINRHPPSLRR